MRYYHVWVRSDRFRGSEPLTYSYDDDLARGAIVTVPLRNESVLGIIVSRVGQPAFSTKSISSATGMLLPEHSLELGRWLQQFYASPVGVTTALLLPPSLHTNYQDAVSAAASILERTTEQTTAAPALTAEQANALAIIASPETYLLHGRTGSGKTRIYIELTRQCLAKGRSAIILCPEIGLTSQIASQFQSVFGNNVLVLHSQMTMKEREITWRTILSASEPRIVIGPRSALFSPLKDVGLIVVDESHDQAYKQEQPPYYEASRTAAQLRSIHNAILVLGSATPSIRDYYTAIQRHKHVIRLRQLARGALEQQSNITIVDLKNRTQFSRSPHISKPLTDAIAASLQQGEQALLYLNRRGTARVTICDACGWQALCPHCDLPLAYHADQHRLQCHTCGHRQTPFLSCPECGNRSITLRSFGTKAIAHEVSQLFPEARILRLDTDSAKGERLENQYERIRSGGVDILVGTQMIAKGLDLPRLSTLGIVLADSSLYLPDYTAQERTYQLLTQVMGRVGRGHTASNTVVQTYYPESPLLRAALTDDWDYFYQAELAERRSYNFPPFCNLLKISCKRATRLSAERATNKFRQELDAQNLGIHIDGPTPCFHEKSGGQYRWQLIIKAHQRSELLRVIGLLPNGWSYDLDPTDLL